jgi:hypothetical protein
MVDTSNKQKTDIKTKLSARNIGHSTARSVDLLQGLRERFVGDYQNSTAMANAGVAWESPARNFDAIELATLSDAALSGKGAIGHIALLGISIGPAVVFCA